MFHDALRDCLSSFKAKLSQQQSKSPSESKIDLSSENKEKGCSEPTSHKSKPSYKCRASDQCTASYLKRQLQRRLDELCQEYKCLGLKRHLTESDVDGDKIQGGIQAKDGKSLRAHGFQPGTRDVELAEFMTREEVAELRQFFKGNVNNGVGSEEENVKRAEQLLRVGSEDPGERTFTSVYDIWNGVVWYCGDGWTDRQFRKVLREIDQLKSKRDQKLHRQGVLSPKEAAKYADRLSRKWTQLRRNRLKLHQTVAQLYGALFSIVIRPDFRTGGMTRKQRRISGKVSRRLRSLGFHDFKKRLEQVALNTDLVIVTMDESFTSKICGSCGHYHRGLGKSKVFHCPSCGTVEERGKFFVF